jgi:hypothetical protein
MMLKKAKKQNRKKQRKRKGAPFVFYDPQWMELQRTITKLQDRMIRLEWWADGFKPLPPMPKKNEGGQP